MKINWKKYIERKEKELYGRMKNGRGKWKEQKNSKMEMKFWELGQKWKVKKGKKTIISNYDFDGLMEWSEFYYSITDEQQKAPQA